MAENRQPVEPADAHSVDVVIITVLEEENKAILQRLPNSVIRPGKHRTYSVGSIQDRIGRTHTVAAVRTPEQGESAAQETARDAIEDLNPALIVLVGIAGGVPDREVTLGDVVFATRLHDFTVGARLEGKQEEFAQKGGPMTNEVLDLAALLPALKDQLAGWEAADSIGVPRPRVSLSEGNFYGKSEWRKKTKASLQFHFYKKNHRTVPIVTTKAIASGGNLIKDTQVVSNWLKSARDLTAIEMELAGVYAATNRRNRQYPIIAIRSLSDIVGFKRDDNWTRYACQAAASFCFSLLKNMPSNFTFARRSAKSESTEINSDSDIADGPSPVSGAGRFKRTAFSDLESLLEVVKVLDNLFDFRWEPSSFDLAVGKPLVYWPIRLRHPTLIHAVQCFIAASLQQRGAEIHLFLDDLGTPDHSIENLSQSLMKWFESMGGSRKELTLTQFSSVLQTDSQPGSGKADPWPSIREWLGDTQYLLANILRISKLVPLADPDFTIHKLEQKRPRRLLTPALVWSCLVFLRTMYPERPIVTLGGYDERPLWQAWRDCSTDTNARVGHLYVPQLSEVDGQHGTRPVHMENTKVSIEWTSRDDIKHAIQSEFVPGGRKGQWHDKERLIPWSIACCVLLPRFLKGLDVSLKVDGVDVNQFTSLASLKPAVLTQALADELVQWLM